MAACSQQLGHHGIVKPMLSAIQLQFTAESVTLAEDGSQSNMSAAHVLPGNRVRSPQFCPSYSCKPNRPWRFWSTAIAYLDLYTCNVPKLCRSRRLTG